MKSWFKKHGVQLELIATIWITFMFVSAIVMGWWLIVIPGGLVLIKEVSRLINHYRKQPSAKDGQNGGA